MGQHSRIQDRRPKGNTNTSTHWKGTHSTRDLPRNPHISAPTSAMPNILWFIICRREDASESKFEKLSPVQCATWWPAHIHTHPRGRERERERESANRANSQK